jgi:hypothetical protein
MDDSVESSSLLRNADLALYKAKTDGRGISRVYEPQMSLQLRREVEQDRRQALGRGPARHPLSAADGAERGVEADEALLRWNHPQKAWFHRPTSFNRGIKRDRTHWKLGWNSPASWQYFAEEAFCRGKRSPAQFKSGKLVDVVSAALKI